MRSFFAKVERPSDVRILWEPRGAWPPDLVATLCRELELVHVVDPFVSTTVTPEQTYFRLHGISGARHVYTDAELEQLADMLPTGEGSARLRVVQQPPPSRGCSPLPSDPVTTPVKHSVRQRDGTLTPLR